MASVLDNPALREAALPISVEQYHQLGEAGIIAESTELLRGVIVEKMVKSPRHTWLVQFLTDWLQNALPQGIHVRSEQPLTLAESEPEPDLAVVQGTRDDYRRTHPSTAELVIEIATSREELDRQKASIYAAAGVREYWIIVDRESAVEVYRDPTPTGYQLMSRATGGDILRAEAIEGATLDLADLFE